MRRLGWEVEVFVPQCYPEQLLYQRDGLQEPSKEGTSLWALLVHQWKKGSFFMKLVREYDALIIYGSSEVYRFLPNRLHSWLLKRRIAIDVALLRGLGKTITYIPSGCREEALKKDYGVIHPQLCKNCGVEKCDDEENLAVMETRKKYAHTFFPPSPMATSRIPKIPFRYKALDLELWKPNLTIPQEFRQEREGKIRVLHSFSLKGREHGGKNIKGSGHVLAAVERLAREGYPVESFQLSDVPSRHMRYYQAQGDILVDQLIYGWWGSTSIEGMALGKPVVCFLHPQWKKEFFRTFPQYTHLPIVEARRETLYTVLKALVMDPSLRKSKGRESRAFAEAHFDVKTNAPALGAFLQGLSASSREVELAVEKSCGV